MRLLICFVVLALLAGKSSAIKRKNNVAGILDFFCLPKHNQDIHVGANENTSTDNLLILLFFLVAKGQSGLFTMGYYAYYEQSYPANTIGMDKLTYVALGAVDLTPAGAVVQAFYIDSVSFLFYLFYTMVSPPSPSERVLL